MADTKAEKATHLLAAKGNTPAAFNADESGLNEVDKEDSRKPILWNWITAALIVTFILVIIIISFICASLKTRHPRYGIKSATFDTFDVRASSPHSFNLKMNTQLSVNNANFGPYKFKDSTINFFYNGTQVGTAAVRKSKVGTMKTKKFNVVVDLIAPKSDIISGILSLMSESNLTGKLAIFGSFKKTKTTKLDCTMDVNISTKTLQNVKCKHKRNKRVRPTKQRRS